MYVAEMKYSRDVYHVGNYYTKTALLAHLKVA